MDSRIAQNKNRLAQAASAYLRSAQQQPVSWHEWGPEAFAKAQEQNTPILLSIGAGWCHWCHVMDQESYSDPETAALINEAFVAIKVDRDERPDVDARHQAAVAAISGQGGWPLTVFLTPEGKPFSGGTYFSANERVGRPGFRRVLEGLAEAFRAQPAEAEESGASVLEAIQESETFTLPGEPNEALSDRILSTILHQFDPRYGGFGTQPKFPHAASLELLLEAANGRSAQSERAREAVRLTLIRMADGGLRDQLAGGFHRYSVDERWIVPRFEKMAPENSGLLRLYAHASQTLAEPRFAHVASTTLAWMDEVLCNREEGGFYAWQNGEAMLGDNGDYFTWTRAEAESVLSPEELAVVERHFHLRAVGHMQHQPARNVLHIIASLHQVAEDLRVSLEEVEERFSSARSKLLAARAKRPSPFVDRTIYTGWNALCISAYLAAGNALARADATAFALQSLERVAAAAWDPEEGLQHVVHYGRFSGEATSITATLEEYAYLGEAALDAYDATGARSWLGFAQELADYLLAHFYDAARGGFFDAPQRAAEADAGVALGALAASRKPIQDAPTPAGNAAAASLLLRLHRLTGTPVYRQQAEATLQAFAGMAEQLGLYVAGYGQALGRLLSSL